MDARPRQTVCGYSALVPFCYIFHARGSAVASKVPPLLPPHTANRHDAGCGGAGDCRRDAVGYPSERLASIFHYGAVFRCEVPRARKSAVDALQLTR